MVLRKHSNIYINISYASEISFFMVYMENIQFQIGLWNLHNSFVILQMFRFSIHINTNKMIEIQSEHFKLVIPSTKNFKVFQDSLRIHYPAFPIKFMLTYVDDEGDTINLMKEQDLIEYVDSKNSPLLVTPTQEEGFSFAEPLFKKMIKKEVQKQLNQVQQASNIQKSAIQTLLEGDFHQLEVSYQKLKELKNQQDFCDEEIKFWKFFQAMKQKLQEEINQMKPELSISNQSQKESKVEQLKSEKEADRQKKDEEKKRKKELKLKLKEEEQRLKEEKKKQKKEQKEQLLKSKLEKQEQKQDQKQEQKYEQKQQQKQEQNQEENEDLNKQEQDNQFYYDTPKNEKNNVKERAEMLEKYGLGVPLAKLEEIVQNNMEKGDDEIMAIVLGLND